MANRRQEIRDAVKAMLTNATDANANVYVNRVLPTFASKLPSIQVYCGSETSQPRAVNTQKSLRTLSLIIEIVADGNDELDDTLDLISQQVETIIAANHTLSATATSCVLQSTEPEFSAEGQKRIGRLTLNFETKYLD